MPGLSKKLVLGIFSIFFLACHRGGTSQDQLTSPTFAAVTPLNSTEVDTIIQQAAESVDSADLSIAVVDRVGNLLGLWMRNAATSVADQNITISLARTAAFLSHSQAPLTTRTGEFITTFHFPPAFGSIQSPVFASLAGRRETIGVTNTGQGPLWQLDFTNRGAQFAGVGLTTPDTLYNSGKELPQPVNVDSSVPTPGFTLRPGGVPLYKGGRLVGGIGCYGADPNVCEFAALAGRVGFDFPVAVPPEGAVYLVGILLPNVEQTDRPSTVSTGSFVGTTVVASTSGAVDPEGYLIGPRADPLGGFTLEQVETIIEQCLSRADKTRAAIRLPNGSKVKMTFAVTNLDGLILALYRMEDGTIFSSDVAITKARTVTYFSSSSLAAEDQIPGIPLGTAMTTRTLGFLSQPFFPPGIDSSGTPGPLYDVAQFNQDPANYNGMGHASAAAGLQSGLVFFPGAAPLYDSSGNLIGGLGVSGDGVEQDDYVTAGGVAGFEPPVNIRADNYSFEGVPLPYFKFPQNPGPGE